MDEMALKQGRAATSGKKYSETTEVVTGKESGESSPSSKSDVKAGNEMESGENVSIKDLNSLVMLQLCEKLDIEQILGDDYRDLAARFGIPYRNISEISQGQNKTRGVLNWIGGNPGNTVAKLRQILVYMRRDDCVEIIDKRYFCGEWEHRMRTSREEKSRPNKETHEGSGPSTSIASAKGVQMTNQFAEISSISHLDPLARIRICRKLDIKHPVCGDYRELAAHFDMPNTDIIVISQNPDPTDNVLHTIQRNPKNTIAKLRQVLVIMGRDDCVMIIDESLLALNRTKKMWEEQFQATSGKKHSETTEVVTEKESGESSPSSKSDVKAATSKKKRSKSEKRKEFGEYSPRSGDEKASKRLEELLKEFPAAKHLRKLLNQLQATSRKKHSEKAEVVTEKESGESSPSSMSDFKAALSFELKMLQEAQVGSSSEYTRRTHGESSSSGTSHEVFSGSHWKQFKINDLNPEEYDKICDKLNIINCGRDYKTLAGRMRYSVYEIRKFELCENPSDALLSHWGKKSGNTVIKLIEILKDMGNDAAAEMLEKARATSGKKHSETSEVVTDKESGESSPSSMSDFEEGLEVGEMKDKLEDIKETTNEMKRLMVETGKEVDKTRKRIKMKQKREETSEKKHSETIAFVTGKEGGECSSSSLSVVKEGLEVGEMKDKLEHIKETTEKTERTTNEMKRPMVETGKEVDKTRKRIKMDKMKQKREATSKKKHSETIVFVTGKEGGECSSSSMSVVKEGNTVWFKADLLNEDFNLKDDHQDFLKGLSWVQAFGIAGPNNECKSLHLVVTYKYGKEYVLSELVEQFGQNICNFIEFVEGVEHPSFSFLVNDNSTNGADKAVPSSGDGIYIWGQDPGSYGSLGLFAFEEENGEKKHFASTCYHVLYPTELSEDGIVRYNQLSKDFSNESSDTRKQWFYYLSREDRKKGQEVGDCDESKEHNGEGKYVERKHREEIGKSKEEELEERKECQGEECEEKKEYKGKKCGESEKCEARKEFKGEECANCKEKECEGVECEKPAEVYFGKCLSGKKFRGNFNQEHDFALLLLSDDFARHGLIEDIHSSELISNSKIVEWLEEKGEIPVEKTGCRTGTTRGILKQSGYPADCFNYKNGYLISDADPKKPFLDRGDSGGLVKVLLGDNESERYMFAYVVGRINEHDSFCFNLKKSFEKCKKYLEPCLKECQKKDS